MADGWKFVSEDAETSSLHDHCITRAEEAGPDLVLHFDDDGYMDPPPPGSEDGFVTVLLSCDRLLFCWDDLPTDAWFQERPKM